MTRPKHMKVRWHEGQTIRTALVHYLRFSGKDATAVVTTTDGETIRIPNSALLDGWWKGA